MNSTPYYVFDTDEFAKRAAMIKAALGNIHLCFSIKANPFLLHRIPEGLDRVEVCSPGELEICIALGIDPSSIIYSGVMKEETDITRAITYGAGILTCESIRHARLESKVALSQGKKVDVILRLSSGNQFGMSLTDIEYIISNPDEFKGISVIGLHYYSGTQKSLRKIKKDLDKIESAISTLDEKYGFKPDLIEYGPGLCVYYFEPDWEEKEKAALDEAATVLKEFAEKYPLGIEMGRFLAASCGKYFTTVKDIKTQGDANYVILDGGIHHLNYFGQRMAMEVPPIRYATEGKKAPDEEVDYTLFGSLCTVADVLVREVRLPHLDIDDVLEFGHCGAYSMTEAPALFLSRFLPAIYAYSSDKGYELLRDHIPASDINKPVTE
ncbi:MAG: diaminopimelate decarboxylase [[Eubacterium] rectale]|nr:diaminopimelate decarboxylase [Agathobacter rectalis]